MSIRVMLAIVLMALPLMACDALAPKIESRTTDTRSTSFATDAEKVAFLERYLTLASAVEQAEFHVVYHDNSGGLIDGPSDWNIEAAMRVASDDVVRWTDGMQPLDAATADLAWAQALLQQAGWNTSSGPAVYERSGALVAVYEQDGIVAKRVWTTP